MSNKITVNKLYDLKNRISFLDTDNNESKEQILSMIDELIVEVSGYGRNNKFGAYRKRIVTHYIASHYNIKDTRKRLKDYLGLDISDKQLRNILQEENVYKGRKRK